MLHRSLAFILAASLCAFPLGAADHLVTQKTADAKVAAAARERTQNLATIDEALSSPKVVKAATSAGVDLAKAKGALPSLSDRELRDLATRAESLKGDPVSGYHEEIAALTFIMVLAAMVAVILIVADHY
jgi:hypothetical protein